MIESLKLQHAAERKRIPPSPAFREYVQELKP